MFLQHLGTSAAMRRSFPREPMYPNNATLYGDWWCREWTSANHIIYQLANLLFATAFIIPDEFRYHAKLFR